MMPETAFCDALGALAGGLPMQVAVSLIPYNQNPTGSMFVVPPDIVVNDPEIFPC